MTKEEVKALITEKIKTNGKGEITAKVLAEVLNAVSDIEIPETNDQIKLVDYNITPIEEVVEAYKNNKIVICRVTKNDYTDLYILTHIRNNENYGYFYKIPDAWHTGQYSFLESSYIRFTQSGWEEIYDIKIPNCKNIIQEEVTETNITTYNIPSTLAMKNYIDRVLKDAGIIS